MVRIAGGGGSFKGKDCFFHPPEDFFQGFSLDPHLSSCYAFIMCGAARISSGQELSPWREASR